MSEGTRRVPLEQGDEPPGTLRVPLGAELDSEGTQRVPADLRQLDAAPVRGPITLAWQPPGAVLFERYTVVETLQLHETQRPGLYLCDSADGQVMLKVHATELQPDAKLWALLPALKHPNLIRIVEATQREGFYYEVQEYHRGGSLVVHVPAGAEGITARAEWLRTRFLPQVIAALTYLHRQSVVHRDVKPGNVFLRSGLDGDIILGDYDISTMVDPALASRRSTRFMATHVYAAPELFPQIGADARVHTRVSVKSDYWSLGITCIELLVGTTTAHQEGSGGLQQFFMTGRRIGIPQGLPPELEEFLRGVLIRDDQLRWGDDEAARWLHGATTAADRRLIEQDGQAGGGPASLRPYKLGTRSAGTLRELAVAMQAEPNLAADDLLEGDLLLNWIGQHDTNIARSVRHDRERFRHDAELALLAAILRLDPAQPFEFSRGRQARTPEEWASLAREQLRMGPQQHMVLGARAVLDSLALWLELREPAQREQASLVRDIATFTSAQQRIDGVLWLLDPTAPFTFGDGFEAHTPRELVQQAYGRAEQWGAVPPLAYTALADEVESERLAVWLLARGLVDLSREMVRHAHQSDGYPVLRIEKALRLLDSELPPVKVQLDTSAVRRRLGVLYGAERVYALPWTTDGPGVPYATVTRASQDAPYVEPTLINAREGTLYLRLDATSGLQPVGRYESEVVLEGGFVAVDPARVQVNYGVAFPHHHLLLRVGAGALAGMLVLGLVRLLLGAVLGRVPITLGLIDVPHIWDDVRTTSFETLPLIFALVVVLIASYGCFRLLLHVMSHGEV